MTAHIRAATLHTDRKVFNETLMLPVNGCIKSLSSSEYLMCKILACILFCVRSVGPPPELVRHRETKWINIISQWDRILLKKTSKVCPVSDN